MLTATGFHLPGTTEPERIPGMAERLAGRQLDHALGGTELMFSFARLDPHVIYHSPTHSDFRNEIIANCIALNCWSVIHWRVERRPLHSADAPWTAYAGVWNEKLGVGVLINPHVITKPHIWLSQSPETFRMAFDLARY